MTTKKTRRAKKRKVRPNRPGYAVVLAAPESWRISTWPATVRALERLLTRKVKR